MMLFAGVGESADAFSGRAATPNHREMTHQRPILSRWRKEPKGCLESQDRSSREAYRARDASASYEVSLCDLRPPVHGRP